MKLKKCPECRMPVPVKIERCPMCGAEYTRLQYFRMNWLTKVLWILLLLVFIYDMTVIIFTNKMIRGYIEKPPEDIAVVRELELKYNKLTPIQRYFVHKSEIDILREQLETETNRIWVDQVVCSVMFNDGTRSGIYSGQVHDNQPYGQGVFSYKMDDGENRVYEGEFVEGSITGYGVMTFGDGRKYEGEFLNGLLSGEGTQYSAEGIMLQKGQYLNGLLSGEGTICDGNGNEIYTGRFSEGYPMTVEYKNSCREVTYAELESDTESFVNVNLKMNGVVTDIAVREDMTIQYIIKIAGDRNRNLCFEYIGKGVNIREGDNVTFYGYCTGYKPFTDSDGNQMNGMIIKTYFAQRNN